MLRSAAFVLAALVLAPAALAGGNNPAGLQDDLGALDTQSNTRYVAAQDGASTRISALSTTEGTVLRTLNVKGRWGIPRIDQGASLSFDGKTLVLAPTAI